MTFDRRFRIVALGFAVSLVMAAPPSRAETLGCTPLGTGLITKSGIYCMTEDRIADGTSSKTLVIPYAIWITEDVDVVLDLNGHALRLDPPAPRGSETFGIYVENGGSASHAGHITIRNGTISGFYTGILIDDKANVTLEDLVVADSQAFGILVTSTSGSVIRRCQVLNTGGSNTWDDWNGFGIGFSYSSAARVLDTKIVDVRGTGSGAGFGIDLFASSPVVISNNRIASVTYGISDSIVAGKTSTGVYRENIVSGASTAYNLSGGMLDGGRNSTGK